MGSVRVTAADYNGHDWDGSPFDWDGRRDGVPVPQWLLDAVKGESIRVSNYGSTDYATWDVDTALGPVTAGPGDKIGKDAHGFLVVTPGPDHKDYGPQNDYQRARQRRRV